MSVNLENLKEAARYVVEAAKLHLELHQDDTAHAVTTALRWRYGVSKYEADELHGAALRLLDAMPRP